jgi:hypothetical protein
MNEPARQIGDSTANVAAMATAPVIPATEPAKPRAPRNIWSQFAQRMCVYFVIYVFSLGPMYWHWYEGKYVNGSKLVAAFYEPLFLLSHWIPPLGWFVNAYVHVWVFDFPVWMA